MAQEVQASEVAVTTTTAPAKAGSELEISALDPDADGDGNVSPLEMEIYKALKAADIDGSGSIGVGELYKVIGDLVGEKRKVKNLSKLVFALLVIVVLALASIFVVSMLAGNAIKESKVDGSLGGEMTTPDGLSAVRVDGVESTTSLWDLPKVDTNDLAKMKDLVFYADLSTDATVGTWVEATFKVAGVYKASNDVATIVMTSGEKVVIRNAAQTGDLLMDGKAYPISDECTGACSAADSRRRLATDAAVTPVKFDGPRNTLYNKAPVVAEGMNHAPHPKRRARRGAFLSASGSFKMSATSNRGGNT